MHTTIALSALLALLTGSLTSSQTELEHADTHGGVKEAAALESRPVAALQFTVSGLTKDNVDKVKQSLTALETPVYVCVGCKHEQATAGRCAPCSLDLKPTKETLFSDALPSLENQTIRVTPMVARTLRYADLEAALMKNSIQIDATKFPIAGNARLVLLGGTLENARAIEKALVDAKIFETVKADYDAPSSEIRVMVHASTTPPMRAKVLSLIEGLGTKAKLTDVIWAPEMPTKA